MINLVKEFPLTHRQHLILFPRGRHIRYGKHGRPGKGSVTNKTTTTREFFLLIPYGSREDHYLHLIVKSVAKVFQASVNLVPPKQTNQSEQPTCPRIA